MAIVVPAGVDPLGVNAVVVLWVQVGVRVSGRTDAWWLAGPPLAFGVAALILAARRYGTTRVTPHQLRAFAPVLVASAVAFCAWFAVLATGDNAPAAAVPPYDDGLRHGWGTARWLALGDVDAGVVWANDAIGVVPVRGSSPYPMALSLLAGTVAQLSGSTIAASLDAVVVLAAVLWLPLSAWAFARAAFPSDLLMARALPVVSLAAPVAYYSAWPFGGLPFLVAGTGVLAASTAAILVVGRRSVPGAAMSGVVVGSILLVQAAVGLLALLLAAPMGVVALRRRHGSLSDVVKSLGVAALAATAVCGWQVLGIVTTPGVGRALDAVGTDASPVTSLARAVFNGVLQNHDVSTPWAFFVAMALTLVVAALVVTGTAMALRSGNAVDVVLVLWLLLLLVLSWLTILRPPGLAWLTGPWYGNTGRLAGLTGIVVTVVVARAVAGLVRRARQDGAAAGRVAVAGLCLPLVLAAAVALDRIASTVSTRSLVTADDRAAFDWLATRRPTGPVLDDPWGAGGWSYAYAGVDPVFPGSVPPGAPAYVEATYLLENITSIATDPRAQAAAGTLGVRYVFASPARMIPEPAPFTPVTLATAPGLTEVFRSGYSVVYEIQPAFRVDPGSVR